MNEGQVAQKIIHHMHADHGMKVIPADFMIKMKYSINTRNIASNVSPDTATELLVAR